MTQDKYRKHRTQYLVIGGGIAGIVTAMELLNAGAKVLVLDRDGRKNFGGLAKQSFGGMFFVDSPLQRKRGIQDHVDLAMDDWSAVADFDAEDVWPRRWAEALVHNATPHVYEFLRQKGVGFFPMVQWVERGLLKRGNSVPRFHLVWGTGFELSERLKNNLINHPNAKHNLELLFGHRVEELMVSNGRIVGARGVLESDGKAFETEAEITIVATGGLGGDIEQVKRNWPTSRGPAPGTILNGAHRYADGMLHRAVEAIGGRITHLDQTWPYAAGVHHPRPSRPNDGLSLVPPRSALWLNYRGERIGPVPLVTAYDTRYLVDAICRQDKKYSWQVMNKRILQKEFAISGAEHNAAFRNKSYLQVAKTLLFGNKALVNDMLEHCPDFVTADSLENLAEKMNALTGQNDVSAQAMTTAIRGYDAEIARGRKYHNDMQLRLIAHLRNFAGDRVRTCKFQKVEDPKHRPYVAVREHILSRKTLGGVQTDLSSRVLDEKGLPLPGLYAVGEAAGYGGGGAHGKGALEGTFLSSCVLTARVAAFDILGKKLY